MGVGVLSPGLGFLWGLTFLGIPIKKPLKTPKQGKGLTNLKINPDSIILKFIRYLKFGLLMFKGWRINNRVKHSYTTPGKCPPFKKKTKRGKKAKPTKPRSAGRGGKGEQAPSRLRAPPGTRGGREGLGKQIPPGRGNLGGCSSAVILRCARRGAWCLPGGLGSVSPASGLFGFSALGVFIFSRPSPHRWGIPGCRLPHPAQMPCVSSLLGSRKVGWTPGGNVRWRKLSSGE